MSRHSGIALLSAVFLTTSARAETPVAAEYQLRLAGLPVGRAQLTVDLTKASYAVSLRGRYGVPGLAGTFEASAEGSVAGTRASPASYRASRSSQPAGTTTVAFAGEDAVRASIEPPPTSEWLQDRVPLEDRHRDRVVDPLSAILRYVLRSSAKGADPCTGRERIFSGWARFDLTLARWDGGEERSGEVVCRAVYAPIAGHRSSAGRHSLSPDAGPITIAFPGPASTEPLRLPSRVVIPVSIGSLVIERLR